MLNYLKKFTVDIFPSVAATVIGAYIVNHYIVSRPGTDAPAAAVSTADSKGKAKATTDANPEGTTAVSNLPAAGVKARGISEKAVMEKKAAEQRPAAAEKAQEKADAKAETAKAETAKAETAKAETAKAETAKADAKTDTRHDAKSTETSAPREKEKIRVVLPSPIQPAASAQAPAASTHAPVAAAPNPVAPVDTAAAPAPVQEERRDANDLARAAIERLRLNGEGTPRAPEVARIPDASRETPRAEAPKAEAPKAESPRVAVAPVLRPLPPPVMISAPPTAGEPYGQAAPQRPPYAANVEDPRRPTPPAEIPLSRPLDLRAEAAEPSVRQRTEAAAEEVLSTAKSLFHAVLPK
jgi:hypothetical protein